MKAELPPKREILTVEIGRKQRAQLEALGRRIGLPAELQVLEAIRRYVEKRRGS
jgi:hypothetical protein